MEIQRRTVLQAGGLVAVGGLVAACGSSEPAAASSSAAPAPASSAPAASASASGGGQAVAAVADIPVGGGVILAEPGIVVTQPAEGDVKAFSAICTHQGCLVSEVVDNQIICPCHNSIFSATDGSVIQGPATEALPAAGVTVDGGNVVLS